MATELQDTIHQDTGKSTESVNIVVKATIIDQPYCMFILEYKN